MTLFGFNIPPIGDIGQFMIGAAAIYGAWQAWSAKREAKRVNDKVTIIQHNTNSMTEKIAQLSEQKGATEEAQRGEAVNEKTAKAREEGFQRGRVSAPAPAALTTAPASTPVPVIDEKLVEAIDKHTDAIEKVTKDK